MRYRFILLATMLTVFAVSAEPTLAIKGDYSNPPGRGKKAAVSRRGPAAKKGKPFKQLIKDRVVVPGLFTFYHDTTDNSWLMAIRPDQLEKVYLCGISIVQGDGAFLEGGRMAGTMPCYFKRVGKNILMLEKNVRFTADSTSPAARAVARGVSDGLIGTAQIQSLPDDSSGAVLVDPSPYFVRDVLNLSFFLGQLGRTGFSFDRGNSGFAQVKSFPENTEVAVRVFFKSRKPVMAEALQNPYSFSHVYNYSLSTLPETDYVPRYADDRIGHFLAVRQDYTHLDRETPYVRYINRWHLKKKNPGARVSAPEEPIVFWIENTVPKEFRDAIARGVEFWNRAFEKIGFRNAIIARQMPDTATWDPADVRYSTIRWLVSAAAPYTAIGPSRINPYTGQIYDADVGIVADAIRSQLNNAEYRVAPVTFNDRLKMEREPWRDSLTAALQRRGFMTTCELFDGMKQQSAFAEAYFNVAVADPQARDSVKKEFINAFLTFVVAHEVGHTLGFRHNFKASAVYSLEQINDTSFTREHGLVGTVMDYPAPNLAGKGRPQGEFYNSVPGPYDLWVVEYAYSDFGASTPDEELPQLERIASRAPEPGLYYGTDEDTFGFSTKSVDPLCNIWDLGDDPIAYLDHNVGITQEIWQRAIKEFEQPGTRYQKILRVFQSGWWPYIITAFTVPKFVGGLYHDRMHIGDAPDRTPFRVVPAEKQRRAVTFLRDRLFAPDAFKLPADLLNKLEQENLEDFLFSAWSVPQVDYPFHQVVLAMQNTALYQLYSPYVLGRLQNNLARLKPGEPAYTMYDLFTDLRGAIWAELESGRPVNSFRRQLQLSHLNILSNIYLSGPTRYPMDARTLASRDLTVLEQKAREALKQGRLDGMTRTHYKEVLRQIAAAREAAYRYTWR